MKLKETVTKVFIACDHGGLPLKNKIIEAFPSLPLEDLGTSNEESVDYPDFANLVAENIKDSSSCGILVCGSGQGMAIRANKYRHIRAALCWNMEVTELSREHNNANILCLGSRVVDHDLALDMVKCFFETEFAGGRHERRVEKIGSPT